jgi:hypothetical protein
MVYSQCDVHIVVGPCTKGHFIHAGSLGPGVLLLLLIKGCHVKFELSLTKPANDASYLRHNVNRIEK